LTAPRFIRSQLWVEFPLMVLEHASAVCLGTSERWAAAALKTQFNWLRVVSPKACQPAEYRKQRPAPLGLLLAAPDLSTFVGVRDHFLMAT
jgi:hypothetical protein